MEKIKDSKVAHFFGKVAVECEPGLTNTQLMLTNHDLKPVEPERRQWGAWNFTGLWIELTLLIQFEVETGMERFLAITKKKCPQKLINTDFNFKFLPAIWLPVHKVRHLFTVKAFIVPVAGVAFFVWAIAKAHGLGPIVHQPSTATGSDLRWAIIKGIMSSIANFAALIVNNPDFSRFARKPSDALWSQMLTIPIGFAFTSIIGIFVSSSSNVIYGKPIWNPLDLLDSFLNEGDLRTRFGVFIIAASFTLAQLGTNIAANSISAGTDMTALAPRFLTIRRGGYICATTGLLICPWNLLKGDNQFTTYLSAYSVFLSSIAGVIVCDYYFVRRGYIQVEDLYSGRRSGPYFFTHGIHWRAYAAYVSGILINIIGFLGACGWKVPEMAEHIYNFNFFGGFIVSALTYWTLCRVSPIPACANEWLEVETDGSKGGRAYDVENSSDTERD
ncbi:hypothetical protein EG328_011809 [Venturia inaequalis]|uniref:Uracil permease n=1 Tax=Venturia inaequalis TaxID=5025 RepID=A0A8H3YMH2_VENIN|nr:hypothetical protein EG328_011809 [Venturia inaequalis]